MLKTSIRSSSVSSVFRLFATTGDNNRVAAGSFTIIQAGIGLVRGFGDFLKNFLNGAGEH